MDCKQIAMKTIEKRDVVIGEVVRISCEKSKRMAEVWSASTWYRSLDDVVSDLMMNLCSHCPCKKEEQSND